jgi:hypothetical protein
VLDTFVVLNDPLAFERGVRDTITHVSFGLSRPHINAHKLSEKAQMSTQNRKSSRRPSEFSGGSCLLTSSRQRKANLSIYRGTRESSSPWLMIWVSDCCQRSQLQLDCPSQGYYPVCSDVNLLIIIKLNLRHGVMPGETLETCTPVRGASQRGHRPSNHRYRRCGVAHSRICHSLSLDWCVVLLFDIRYVRTP